MLVLWGVEVVAGKEIFDTGGRADKLESVSEQKPRERAVCAFLSLALLSRGN